MKEPLIRVENLSKHYKIGKNVLRAVNNISFSIFPGETLGLVGESGCGKSTIGKSILRLTEPSEGAVFYHDQNLMDLSEREMKKMRRKLQIVFQDPYASLNPRMTVQDIIGEPLSIHKLAKGQKRNERIHYLLELVGLNSDFMSRFAHEFSGGQRQRIGIARALAVEPEFLICDEPISALDVSIQAQIVNLLKKLQETMNLTFLFIAHDLSMIKYISDRVAVMYLGELMELGSSEHIYANPLHPYTQALLSAIPIPDPTIERTRKRIVLNGEIPTPIQPMLGCPFSSRCLYATKLCYQERPVLKEMNTGHFAACHLL